MVALFTKPDVWTGGAVDALMYFGKRANADAIDIDTTGSASVALICAVAERLAYRHQRFADRSLRLTVNQNLCCQQTTCVV